MVRRTDCRLVYLVELGCRRSVDDARFFLLLPVPLDSMLRSRGVHRVQVLRRMLPFRVAYKRVVVDQMYAAGCDPSGWLLLQRGGP